MIEVIARVVTIVVDVAAPIMVVGLLQVVTMAPCFLFPLKISWCVKFVITRDILYIPAFTDLIKNTLLLPKKLLSSPQISSQITATIWMP